jgi:hypothetical protein
MAGRALATWVAMLAIAIINGAVREAWLIPGFGEQRGHQASTVLLSTMILVLTFATVSWIAPTDRRQALFIGLGWVGLTLAFEFLAGHYASGKAWRELLAEYDILHGRTWILVLITTGLAPLIALSTRAFDAP